MGGNSNVKLIDENGIRIDGRRADELRPIKIEAGVLKNADGSAYVEIGKNKVLAAVYGPRECHPRHMQNPAKAIVQVKYNMISFSVDDRKRPGPDRRSVEISKIISEAMEHVVFTENYPRTSIDVFIEVLQANAGTRCAGLTAASVALADAGIPMKDLVPAIAVGKVNDQIVLDLNKEEDNFGQADLPIAMIPRTGEIVLMQMDGHMTYDEFNYALELGTKACKEIYELQKDALRRRYIVEASEPDQQEQAVAGPDQEA
ncbi:MAG: exosome complex exonuclease Rrp41 [Methanomassiliicoccales archaeon]|nr:MAG: exosome complex exonuclease Rrp41 [Methanomassiliicoccales archaeon]